MSDPESAWALVLSGIVGDHVAPLDRHGAPGVLADVFHVLHESLADLAALFGQRLRHSEEVDGRLRLVAHGRLGIAVILPNGDDDESQHDGVEDAHHTANLKPATSLFSSSRLIP